MAEQPNTKRRNIIISAVMGVGLLLSYGTLAVQGLLYLLPPMVGPKRRRIFAGLLKDYGEGTVKTVTDLDGNKILIRRTPEGLTAFNSECPHLGCRVHWEQKEEVFFCPCHRGVFNADGSARSGPPADGGQQLSHIPLIVDERSGVVYLEVKEARKA